MPCHGTRPADLRGAWPAGLRVSRLGLLGSGPCTLTKQVSSSTCTLGDTFGCLGDGTMWAAGGCRGEFTCSGVAGVWCDAMGHGNHTCPCKPGPEPPNPHPNPHPGPGPKMSGQVWARSTKDGGKQNGWHSNARVGRLGWVGFVCSPTRTEGPHQMGRACGEAHIIYLIDLTDLTDLTLGNWRATMPCIPCNKKKTGAAIVLHNDGSDPVHLTVDFKDIPQ